MAKSHCISKPGVMLLLFSVTPVSENKDGGLIIMKRDWGLGFKLYLYNTPLIMYSMECLSAVCTLSPGPL